MIVLDKNVPYICVGTALIRHEKFGKISYRLNVNMGYWAASAILTY